MPAGEVVRGAIAFDPKRSGSMLAPAPPS